MANADDPICFLLGTGRSGTPLLYKLLCLHPEIAYTNNYVARLGGRPALAALDRLVLQRPGLKPIRMVRRRWWHLCGQRTTLVSKGGSDAVGVRATVPSLRRPGHTGPWRTPVRRSPERVAQIVLADPPPGRRQGRPVQAHRQQPAHSPAEPSLPRREVNRSGPGRQSRREFARQRQLVEGSRSLLAGGLSAPGHGERGRRPRTGSDELGA